MTDTPMFCGTSDPDEQERRAKAVFCWMIEQHVGKALDDPTLTEEEVRGAMAVIEAEAAFYVFCRALANRRLMRMDGQENRS